MRVFLLLFIIVPIAEIWVLIQVGGAIGAFSTVALVCLTAIIGVALLRQQGLKTLLKVRQKLDMAELPAEEVLEGVILAVGGALLLTPGFITDAVGFSCLIPFLRHYIATSLLSLLFVGPPVDPSAAAKGPSSSQRGITIDGEYRRED